MSHELILEGTLGVDARRAAAKIRDHLLANPATWLSELGRVAVLSSATQLAIDLRATSIVVEWNGAPIDPEVIEQFGRHLLGDYMAVDPVKRSRGTRPERRPELLTLAVFAALGDVANAVDIRVAGQGDAAKTRRLTREELEGELGDGKARLLSVPRATAFCLLPDATGGVVIELGARIKGLAQWLGVAAPPVAVRELGQRMGSGLAISVDGKLLESVGEQPVLSFELPPVGELAVRLDLLQTPPREPRIVYYELGFEIARSSLLEPLQGLPIRVVVSGAQVPTNASRSQVDETVAENVKREALAGLAIACEGLRAAIVAALARDDRGARDALERVAGHLAVVALRENQADPLFKAFAPVLHWPLLLDAVGRPLGVRDAHRLAGGYEIHCRAQSEPLAPEYAPLVADVLWRRGTSAESAFKLVDYDTIAEDVEAGMRRMRHLATNRVPFEPPPCATARSRHRGVEEGCEWQLTLDAVSGGPSLLRLFVGDDLIETREMESPSPFLRYDAAVRWPGVVVAERTFDRVRVNHGSGRLLSVLDRVVRESLHKSFEASDLRSPGPDRSLALRMLGASLEPPPFLVRLPLWERADGSYAPTADLRAATTQRHLFCMRRPFGPGESAPGEPVLIVADAELPLLRAALGVELMDYAPYASSPRATLESVKRHFIDAKVDCFSFSYGEHLVAVAPAQRGRFVTLHRGLLVSDIPLEDGRCVMFATDGETSLRKGSAEWKALYMEVWERLLSWLSESRERMLGAIAAPMVRDALLARLHAAIVEGRDKTTLLHWPLFVLRTRGGEQFASAAEVAQHFPGSEAIPAVAEGGGNVGECLVASEEDRAAITAITGRACVGALRAAQARKDAYAERVDPSVFDFGPGQSHVPSPPPSVPSASWRPVKLATPSPAQGDSEDVFVLSREAPPPAPAVRHAWEPIRSAPNVAKATPNADGSWPAPTVIPVDPNDILGPVRKQIADATLEHAEATQRAQARIPAPGAASPLVAAPAPPVTRPGVFAAPPPSDTAWDKLVGLFQKPLHEVPGDHPLSTLSRRVTENLYVENLALRFSEAGDHAVRFEKRTMTLVVNPAHATVRVLVENGDVVPLIAAAFSEINRELNVVSDEEERRALGRLLLDPAPG